MRCRCCNTKNNVKATLGDYYCPLCSKSISETISDDQVVYDLTRFEDYGRRYHPDSKRVSLFEGADEDKKGEGGNE